jgi:hypothetical protein
LRIRYDFLAKERAVHDAFLERYDRKETGHLCLQEFVDLRLGHEFVDTGEFSGNGLSERCDLGDEELSACNARIPAQFVRLKVPFDLLETRKSAVSQEAVKGNIQAGIFVHLIDESPCPDYGPLCFGRLVEPEFAHERRETPLEVAHDLAGIVSRRAMSELVPFEKRNLLVRVFEDEKRSRDAGDPGTDDRDVGLDVSREQRVRTLVIELMYPR